MWTAFSRNSCGWPGLADTHDTLHRCRQAQTVSCCQSKPTSTTNLECVSMVRRLHSPSSPPPLVLERSLCDHWRPVRLPTGLGIAHQPLQTSVSLELQLAEPELECHKRPHDARACPLAVRSVTAHTSKPVSLLKSACGASRSSTMIQLSSRVLVLTGRGARVWISLALLLIDIVHLAAALATRARMRHRSRKRVASLSSPKGAVVLCTQYLLCIASEQNTTCENGQPNSHSESQTTPAEVRSSARSAREKPRPAVKRMNLEPTQWMECRQQGSR